jgi:hypothetical protein
MPCYLITYDLNHGTSVDYQELYDAIKAYGTWARVTESSWLIVTSKSSIDVRDHLLSFLHDQDRLFVLKSGVAAAWSNVRCRSAWLKRWL